MTQTSKDRPAGPPAADAGPLTLLAWDSGHFGFPVARLATPDLDDPALHAALSLARAQGFRLVYWQTFPDRAPAAFLLRRHGGVLADRKVTFERALAPRPCEDAAPSWPGLRVELYPRASASPRLRELAVAAGEYSRFVIDARIPRQKFVCLYETWMDRSTRGELADAVLTAVAEGDTEPAGMVTVSVKEGVGNIGLIAVRSEFRGRRVGALLIQAAHDWMRQRGAERATVVTQLANEGACAFYRRSGYQPWICHNYYHFWPMDGEAVDRPEPFLVGSR